MSYKQHATATKLDIDSESQLAFSFEFEVQDAATANLSVITDANFTSNDNSPGGATFIPNPNSNPVPNLSLISSEAKNRWVKAKLWPADVPLPADYSVYDFERFRPELNMFREYQISYQPSLWEEYAVYRMWGRRGQAKQWRSSSFVSEAEALSWVQRMVLRRLRKGYQLVSWSVQLSSYNPSL